jgi:cytochrome c peroxidase
VNVRFETQRRTFLHRGLFSFFYIFLVCLRLGNHGSFGVTGSSASEHPNQRRAHMSKNRVSQLLIALLTSALVACGGGGSELPQEPTAEFAPLSEGDSSRTLASDEAQPNASDPPVLRSDGSSSPERTVLAAAAAPVQDDPAAIDAGEFLFKDTRLSASGKMACVSCHMETFGHADGPGTKLPKGGPNLDLLGMRSSMTARYLNLTPPFRLSLRGTPSGGFLWDGRADDRFEQVFHGGPFFDPVEMALPGSASQPKALTDLVRSGPYWPAVEALYAATPGLIDTDQKLFKQVSVLLETYQRGDADYNLFDSKFDQVQAGTATLSASEARGSALFNDPQRGNCVHCHSSGAPQQQLFTNFGYSALGVPRNHAGPKNADSSFFDLGLCARKKAIGSLSDLLVKLPRYCGLFKTPTLRNVERTAPYFHNASAATLEDAVRFHFERDTQPAKWYRKADGTADRRYNDLPTWYFGNLAQGRPFNGRYTASDADIADIVAFLKTLNDADQTEPVR